MTGFRFLIFVGAAVLLPLSPPLCAQQDDLLWPKVDLPDYPALFGENPYDETGHVLTFASPEEVLEGMKSLKYPWGYVFMAPPKKPDADTPENYGWHYGEVNADEAGVVFVSASLMPAHWHLGAGKHVSVLLRRTTDRRLHVSDLIIRRLGGYNSYSASAVRPLKEGAPFLAARWYWGGRRSGETTHEVFHVGKDEFQGHPVWVPALTFKTVNNEYGLSENCEISGDGGGFLEVKLTRTWGSPSGDPEDGREPETVTVKLPWDPASKSFSTDPLRGVLALMSDEEPVVPAEVVEAPGAAPEEISKVGSIGGVKLKATEDEVRAAIEGRLFKDEEHESAFGWAQWMFPASGITVYLAADKEGGTKKVISVKAEKGSKLKTGRGVGIGSTRAEVLKAYAGFKFDHEGAKFLAEQGSERFAGPDKAILVGDISAGMAFYFKGGMVNEIYLGPLWE